MLVEEQHQDRTDRRLLDQVREVSLAEAIVAQDVERLVEDVGDVVELARELDAEIVWEAVGGEVAPRRLVRAADLERGGVAADAEEREVVGLAHELPARAHPRAIDREIGLADE